MDALARAPDPKTGSAAEIFLSVWKSAVAQKFSFVDVIVVAIDLVHGLFFMVVSFNIPIARCGMTELNMGYQMLMRNCCIDARSVLPYRLVMGIISI